MAASAIAGQRRSDPHPYRAAVLLTSGLVMASLVWTCVLAPAVHDFPGPDRWWIPGDVWVSILPAHFVADGAYAFLYESHPAYVYPPGLALVFAPVAAIGAHFHLSESTTVVVHKPTLWLLIAPAGGALALLPLIEMRRLLRAIRGERHLALLQTLLCVATLAPIIVTWGHYEELIVIAMSMLAIRLVSEARWSGAAFAVGAGLLFKQTALLALPLVLVQTPRDVRGPAFVRMVGPVAVLTVPCLVLDWAHSARALFTASSFPATGRGALWLPGGSGSLVATPMRLTALVLAVVIAARVRRKADARTLACALALITVLRLAFEPVLFPYYLGFPVALAVAASSHRTALPWKQVVLGSALTLLFVAELPRGVWWLSFAGLAFALAAEPMVALRRGRSATTALP